MLNRSNTYVDAALFLLGKRRFNSSVVFFYYSVLQRMMHALDNCSTNRLPYSEQKPINETLYSKITTELCNRIQGNSKDVTHFKELFQQLHDFRVKADYYSENISMDEAVECRALQEKLISSINRFFPVNK